LQNLPAQPTQTTEYQRERKQNQCNSTDHIDESLAHRCRQQQQKSDEPDQRRHSTHINSDALKEAP
tara:strand:- start:198 stop:395 length:198 start_codon:yes stop_codon:yes gene_type:complete